MKDDRVKIILPKDPYQIGVMPNGDPVWVDPKDLIQSPDEKLEQKHNTLASRHAANVDKMAVAVIQNGVAFVEETILNTTQGAVFTDKASLMNWLNQSGYAVIQDGLTTVVKIKGKVLRTMTATIDVRFRGDVSRRVMQTLGENAFAA